MCTVVVVAALISWSDDLRTRNDEDAFSDEFKVSLVCAEHLLDSAAAVDPTDVKGDPKSSELRQRFPEEYCFGVPALTFRRMAS